MTQSKPNIQADIPSPTGLLAELTYRCPLQCPYCSNPVELLKADKELDTSTWISVFEQAAHLGILQTHLSGGEPLLRQDLEEIVETCAKGGIFTNLITSAVGLTGTRLKALKKAGLNHVQISFQSLKEDRAQKISHYKDGVQTKLDAIKMVGEVELPLTLNVPFHRHNLDELDDFIKLGVEVGAHRIEIAQVQYYGWGLLNRAALMPSAEQVVQAVEIVEAARDRYLGVLNIDHVITDYYAKYPKPCMGGWGREVLNIAPDGRVLPCHAAETIPGLEFDRVSDRTLKDIWETGSAFQKFRGFDWMQEPCRSCDRREEDFGGCRCQAMALMGDAAATDPACTLSPHHREMMDTAHGEAAAAEAGEDVPFTYRRIGG